MVLAPERKLFSCLSISFSSVLMNHRFERHRQTTNVWLLYTSASFHSRARLYPINRDHECVNMSTNNVSRLLRATSNFYQFASSTFTIFQTMTNSVLRNFVRKKSYASHRFMIWRLNTRTIYHDQLGRDNEMIP